MSNVPVWVQWVQALGVPIFLALVALAGAWVGWQQMQTARVKLLYDLYERRYKVLEATRDLIRHAAYETDLDKEEIRVLAFAAGEAAFLFNPAIAEYVDDVRVTVSELRNDQGRLLEMPEGAEHAELYRKLKLERHRLTHHLPNPEKHEQGILLTKFKPFLDLPKIKTFPWQ